MSRETYVRQILSILTTQFDSGVTQNKILSRNESKIRDINVNVKKKKKKKKTGLGSKLQCF